MSWFPNFLNPWTALAAAGLAIPALLVLYFLKLRRREMPVSSTLLWRKAIQDLQVNSPFQKLRRNLLLLLQIILLLLLALALSRPVANYTKAAGSMNVILIDRSASMSATDGEGGTTRLEEAKKRAKELVDSMSKNSTAMVVAFDDAAETVQALTTDSLALRHAIDSIQPTDRRTRIKLGYQLADAQLHFDDQQLRPGGKMVVPDVHVFSDGRVLDDPADVRIEGNVILDRIGKENSKNIGVVALSAKRNYERPTEVQVFARLANFGPEPVDSFVEFSIDGAKINATNTKTSAMLLLPERWTDEQRLKWETENGRAARDSVELPLELNDAAVIRVEQTNKEGDVLAADDVASIIVPPPKQLSVLLVTDGNYFLEKALDSLSLKDKTVMTPQDYEQKPPTDIDVMIFDRYRPTKAPTAGNFLYFGAVPPGLKLKEALDETKRPVIVEDQGVLDWRRDHPILRDLSMNKLYVAEAIKIEVPPDSEVLLDGLKSPLVILHREAKSTYLVVPFDLLQSNWPLKVSFPIFLNNSLQFLRAGSSMDVRQSLDPGSTPRIPQSFLKKPGGEPIKQISLEGPKKTIQLTVPDNGDFALPPLDSVGVYKTDPPIPPFDRMAVNLLDPNESNTLPAPNLPGGVAEVSEGAGGRSRVELWWWIIACAALPLLLIEWWVYTRRVHL